MMMYDSTVGMMGMMGYGGWFVWLLNLAVLAFVFGIIFWWTRSLVEKKRK